MIKNLMTLSKNSGRASMRWWSTAPSARARSSSARAAAASMPPQLTVTVTTGRLYVSLSHGTQNDVSRPPENARTMGFDNGGHVGAFFRCCRNRALSRRCSLAPIVATKMVSSPETVPTISGQPLRSSMTATRCAAPIGRHDDEQVGPGRADVAHEFGDDLHRFLVVALG